mmetsp:Transcript_95698/g.275753  ORF Transcript_95698/g.275753 Transcript_95698/m.275753 type:complete len:498 (+) Transcript_95698:188-1681(+)
MTAAPARKLWRPALCGVFWPLVGPSSARMSRRLRECDGVGVACCVQTYGGSKNYYNSFEGRCEPIAAGECVDREQYDAATNSCIDVEAALANRIGAEGPASTTTPRTTLPAAAPPTPCDMACLLGVGGAGGGNVDAEGGLEPRDCGPNGHATAEEPTVCVCDEGWTPNMLGNCDVQELKQSDTVVAINGTSTGGVAGSDGGLADLWLRYRLYIGAAALLCCCLGCCWLRYCGWPVFLRRASIRHNIVFDAPHMSPPSKYMDTEPGAQHQSPHFSMGWNAQPAHRGWPAPPPPQHRWPSELSYAGYDGVFMRPAATDGAAMGARGPAPAMQQSIAPSQCGGESAKAAARVGCPPGWGGAGAHGVGSAPAAQLLGRHDLAASSVAPSSSHGTDRSRGPVSKPSPPSPHRPPALRRSLTEGAPPAPSERARAGRHRTAGQAGKRPGASGDGAPSMPSPRVLGAVGANRAASKAAAPPAPNAPERRPPGRPRPAPRRMAVT